MMGIGRSTRFKAPASGALGAALVRFRVLFADREKRRPSRHFVVPRPDILVGGRTQLQKRKQDQATLPYPAIQRQPRI
jgi:hypothetical protein